MHYSQAMLQSEHNLSASFLYFLEVGQELEQDLSTVLR
jgi:hypothetical protein